MREALVWFLGQEIPALPAPVILGIPSDSDGEESTSNAETCSWSLGWKNLLEEGTATHSSIPAWRIPMNRGAWQVTVHGATKCWTLLST